MQKTIASALVGMLLVASVALSAEVQNIYTVTGNTNGTSTAGYISAGGDNIDAERITISLSTSSAINPTSDVTIVDGDGTTLLSTNLLHGTWTTNITAATGQPLAMANFSIKTAHAQPTNSAAVYPAITVTVTGRN